MIALSIRFPGGRYHATPWNAHVNEAAVEWPPSPWRLLRALLSAWHRTAHELTGEGVRELLESLAEPPTYYLPLGAAIGNTRHYMPLGAHEMDTNLSQTLVIDSFLKVPPGAPLYAVWDGSVRGEARAALGRLASGVTYLGRSESWCDMEIAEEEPHGLRVAPDGAAEPRPDEEVELVPLLAPSRPLDLAALELTTGAMQAARHKLPPGARWVRYARPSSWGRPPATHPVATATPGDRAVSWALDGRPAPLLIEARELARAVGARLRAAAPSVAGRLRVLVYPSKESLPVRLDRVAVFASGDLRAHELRDVCRLGPFRLDGRELVPILLSRGRAGTVSGAIFGPGRVWESVTPAVPWRDATLGGWADSSGPRAEDGLRKAVLAHERRVVGVQATVRYSNGGPRWLDFRQEGARIGGRVEFAEPVPGPLIARGQEPGMGVFRCVG